MSLTRTVPASVPLLFQSSRPLVPSSAAKNSVPRTLVSDGGLALLKAQFGAWINVFDPHRAPGSAIRFPQFKTVQPIIGYRK
jgi:hypothetical protein